MICWDLYFEDIFEKISFEIKIFTNAETWAQVPDLPEKNGKSSCYVFGVNQHRI